MRGAIHLFGSHCRGHSRPDGLAERVSYTEIDNCLIAYAYSGGRTMRHDERFPPPLHLPGSVR
jgi:hypothetical protein